MVILAVFFKYRKEKITHIITVIVLLLHIPYAHQSPKISTKIRIQTCITAYKIQWIHATMLQTMDLIQCHDHVRNGKAW